MAENKVRKGFLFYLLMLFLFVVAVFFVLVVIMIFNPGLNIMGYKYFSNVREYKVSEFDNGQRIDLSKPTNIIVEGNLTNFEIARDAVVSETTVVIENYQTGFATSSQQTDFSYDITYDIDSSSKYNLVIKTVNAEGFMYFNNNCNIKLLIPQDETVLNENSVTVKIEEGNISLGTKELLDESKSVLDINYLDLTTGKGNIVLGNFFEPNISKFVISQKEGNFTALKNITFKDGYDINIKGDGANFSFQNIEIQNSETSSSVFDLDIKEGSFSANNIKANMTLSAEKTKINIDGEFNGNLESNQLVNTMNEMNLTINKISGSMSLPFAENCDINIKDASNAKIFIASKNANVSVEKLSNDSFIKCDEGKINVAIENNKTTSIELVSEKGEISVDLPEKPLASLKILNTSGKTNLNYYPTSNFSVEFYNTKEELRKDKINVEGYENNFNNPLSINGGGVTLKIYSDSEITMKLIKGA